MTEVDWKFQPQSLCFYNNDGAVSSFIGINSLGSTVSCPFLAASGYLHVN